ncbi:MAG: DedA family protein [Armatimonadaceae bacterium]
MEHLIEFLRHPGDVLRDFLSQYGTLTYFLLFGIVFAETGLVIMPFLPGDSLLFAVGAIAADERSGLSLAILYPLFIGAALIGDNLNYWVGRTIGRKLFSRPQSKIFNRAYLSQTEAFFAKYGGRAIVLARFVPIVRTFAPFVAGMGSMNYGRFLAFSIGGALLWVGVCMTAGVMFGNLEVVKKNFELVVLGIVLVSILPPIIELIKHRREQRRGVHGDSSATVHSETAAEATKEPGRV